MKDQLLASLVVIDSGFNYRSWMILEKFEREELYFFYILVSSFGTSPIVSGEERCRSLQPHYSNGTYFIDTERILDKVDPDPSHHPASCPERHGKLASKSVGFLLHSGSPLLSKSWGKFS